MRYGVNTWCQPLDMIPNPLYPKGIQEVCNPISNWLNSVDSFRSSVECLCIVRIVSTACTEYGVKIWCQSYARCQFTPERIQHGVIRFISCVNGPLLYFNGNNGNNGNSTRKRLDFTGFSSRSLKGTWQKPNGNNGNNPSIFVNRLHSPQQSSIISMALIGDTGRTSHRLFARSKPKSQLFPQTADTCGQQSRGIAYWCHLFANDHQCSSKAGTRIFSQQSWMTCAGPPNNLDSQMPTRHHQERRCRM